MKVLAVFGLALAVYLVVTAGGLASQGFPELMGMTLAVSLVTIVACVYQLTVPTRQR